MTAAVHSSLKRGLYRIWCGVNKLGDSGVHTLGETSELLLTGRPAIVNPAYYLNSI